jgi:hypothetical protein
MNAKLESIARQLRAEVEAASTRGDELADQAAVHAGRGCLSDAARLLTEAAGWNGRFDGLKRAAAIVESLTD